MLFHASSHLSLFDRALIVLRFHPVTRTSFFASPSEDDHGMSPLTPLLLACDNCSHDEAKVELRRFLAV
jgi:hypothetical protein